MALVVAPMVALVALAHGSRWLWFPAGAAPR